ncbi:MAG TPA: SH3 domain-containing protein, partial [Acidobacteriaceae bacterium]
MTLFRLQGSSLRTLFLTVCAAGLLFPLAGCSRIRGHGSTQYVYVVSRGTFLRDRVAAVSNKVADVHNAERLTLLQRERRFLQVRTSAGKVGWLEEHAVVDQPTYDRFESLKTQHTGDPVVATAILRDELFLHLAAGRKTDHLFLLPENDKLELLVRASVPKPLPPQGLPAPKPAVRKRPLPRPGKPEKRVPSGSTIWAAAPTHPDK